MPLYDFRCKTCGTSGEIRMSSQTRKEHGDNLVDCSCGGKTEQYFTDVNMTSDCFPTRSSSYGGAGTNAPRLRGVNPGHEKVTSAHIGLNADQCNRLGL